jgi:hypothetical protein
VALFPDLLDGGNYIRLGEARPLSPRAAVGVHFLPPSVIEDDFGRGAGAFRGSFHYGGAHTATNENNTL